MTKKQPSTNPKKLSLLMKAHKLSEADVARILGFKDYTGIWKDKHLTIHRYINGRDGKPVVPDMGWNNIFILLDAHLNKTKK